MSGHEHAAAGTNRMPNRAVKELRLAFQHIPPFIFAGMEVRRRATPRWRGVVKHGERVPVPVAREQEPDVVAVGMQNFAVARRPGIRLKNTAPSHCN